jgi:hypothetical protein
VLVADESESSMDILEVAEESSSESASSASRIAFSDEVTSGDEIEAAPAGAKAAAKPPRKTGEPSTDKVVSDILGPAPEESDEALETLDVDQAVEAKEPSSTGIEAPIEPERAAPVADEHETVGIPAADETKVALGADETKAALTAPIQTSPGTTTSEKATT